MLFKQEKTSQIHIHNTTVTENVHCPTSAVIQAFSHLRNYFTALSNGS